MVADERSAAPFRACFLHLKKRSTQDAEVPAPRQHLRRPRGRDRTARRLGYSGYFQLVAGTLSISTPTASVSLGSQVSSITASTMSGPLGVVSVSDQRGGATTWTVSVISTAFTPPAGPADPASNVSYAAGTITASAGVVAIRLLHRI